jgi:hypothetical protein
MKIAHSSLSLTSDYFKILIEILHETYLKKHELKKLPRTFQLYGYGQYDETKPNLKQDFEAIGTDFINGKYLYDKTRDLYKGKPIIKLNAYYKSILLLYIGYEDFQQFLDDHILSEDEKDKQLSLIYDENINKTYYYTNYYFGEDNVILKGQTIIFNNWKKIKHTYIYPQDDGSLREHYNYGNIIRREDTLHINTKTLLDGKLVEGSSEIYYIGHKTPSNINFLVGTYCTFDIYTNTVAGQSILEKCESKEDMISKSKSPNIPPYIAMEIRNKRIINNRVVPNSYLELSDDSPYASIYNSMAGNYELVFDFENDTTEILEFKILGTNYKIVPITPNVYFEKDDLQLLNKGSVVHLSIDVSGIIAFDRVDIYSKTYYLKDDNHDQKGVFSGIDNENRLVNGTVSINFTSSH